MTIFCSALVQRRTGIGVGVCGGCKVGIGDLTEELIGTVLGEAHAALAYTDRPRLQHKARKRIYRRTFSAVVPLFEERRGIVEKVCTEKHGIGVVVLARTAVAMFVPIFYNVCINKFVTKIDAKRLRKCLSALVKLGILYPHCGYCDRKHNARREYRKTDDAHKPARQTARACKEYDHDKTDRNERRGNDYRVCCVFLFKILPGALIIHKMCLAALITRSII